jgi:hypothetical protein
MIRIATLVTVLHLLLPQQAARNKPENTAMSKNARDYIAAFQRGEDFTPPSIGVFANGQPDDAALEILGKELAVANPNVRENIVKLMVDVGRRTDPLTPKGADVLRHPQIIAILAGAGLAKPDLGREAAMESLRKLVTQPDLARFDDAFSQTLAQKPTAEALLLVAKAKSPKARDLVDRLAREPQWNQVQATRIARAALGTKDVEDGFLAAADAANDGEALARALGPLALMGTPRSVKAIAERLRTPLTIEIPSHMPGSGIKSVRLNVLEALLYNFPDQPVLYPNNINRDEDYRAAERFCIERLGVTYKDPPPPFLKYGNVPVPLAR